MSLRMANRYAFDRCKRSKECYHNVLSNFKNACMGVYVPISVGISFKSGVVAQN
jgi:hypothetical protein